MSQLSDYKQQWLLLRNKKNLSGNAAMSAVQENGYALQYVSDQTEEICKLAVRQNGYALRYVSDQTEEICKLAVQEDGEALQYVHCKFF